MALSEIEFKKAVETTRQKLHDSYAGVEPVEPTIDITEQSVEFSFPDTFKEGDFENAVQFLDEELSVKLSPTKLTKLSVISSDFGSRIIQVKITEYR